MSKARCELTFPASSMASKLGVAGRVLHLLHATQMSVAPGTEVGAYVVHYDDGSIERIPLIYGRDIVDWWSSQRAGLQDAPTGRACCLDWIKRHDRAGPGIQDPSCCSDLDQPSSRQENRDPRRRLRQYALRTHFSWPRPWRGRSKPTKRERVGPRSRLLSIHSE